MIAMNSHSMFGIKTDNPIRRCRSSVDVSLMHGRSTEENKESSKAGNKRCINVKDEKRRRRCALKNHCIP